MNKAYTPSFGSISHGTMRTEDLIQAFAYELQQCAAGVNGKHMNLVEEADAIEDYDSEDYDSEEACEILLKLFDALDEYAPAYGYFGAHPGDGSDYGFWLSEDFEQMILEGDAIKVNDTSEVPEDYSGEVLHVNDHGNCTLYAADHGKLTEVWSVV